MNHKTILATAITASLFALSIDAFAGPKSEPARERTERIIIREEFGSFAGALPYSQTLGLAIPLGSNVKLYEERVNADASLTPSKRSQELQEKLAKNLSNYAKANGGTFISDYSKLKTGITLGFEGDQGSAILLRLRNKFQLLNEDTDGASYLYIDDRKIDDSGSKYNGAIMADIYLHFLYNKPQWFNIGFVENPYRFWIRTGFEANHNDLPGTQEVDQQKFYALLNFQANPDVNANFLAIPGLQITSPQIVQLGAVVERNLVSGEDSTTWIAGWAPVFNILDNGNGIWNGFGLNKRMFLDKKKENAYEVATTTKGTGKADKIITLANTKDPNADRWYTSIDPSIHAFGQSDARGILKALGKKITGARSKKDIEKLREEQLTWDVKALIGYDDGLAELSYQVSGVHAFSDLGNAYIAQEARLDVNVAKAINKLARFNPSPKDWQNFTAFVSYKRGEFAPSFEDIDQLSIGGSVRF